MDYRLDNKIFLKQESKNKSLYLWSLQEYDSSDNNIKGPQIPFVHSVCFTATELTRCYSIELQKRRELNESSECIVAKLRPGIFCDSEIIHDVVYSMFGTNRTINEYSLKIYEILENDDKERCYLWGSVGYDVEIDFEKTERDDIIEICLELTSDRFRKILEQIESGCIDKLDLYMKGVSGFYSEWSPSINTFYIKVLAQSDDMQKIQKNADCSINPSRLGEVADFRLHCLYTHDLNAKQDLYDSLRVHMDEYNKGEKNQNGQNSESELLSQLCYGLKNVHQIRTYLCCILALIFLIFLILVIR